MWPLDFGKIRHGTSTVASDDLYDDDGDDDDDRRRQRFGDRGDVHTVRGDGREEAGRRGGEAFPW